MEEKAILIYQKRYEFINKINKNINDNYNFIGKDGNISIYYDTNIEFNDFSYDETESENPVEIPEWSLSDSLNKMDKKLIEQQEKYEDAYYDQLVDEMLREEALDKLIAERFEYIDEIGKETTNKDDVDFEDDFM